MPLTSKEICKAISADWKRRRITHQMAAEKIGSTKQTVSNQLTGKRRFSRGMAKRFSDAFGYSNQWLLFGEGEMYNTGNDAKPITHEVKCDAMSDDVLFLRTIILSQQRTIESLSAAIKKMYEEK